LSADQQPWWGELPGLSFLRVGSSFSSLRCGTNSQQSAVKAALMKINRVKPS
jgi:hypothetical protein